jgi:TATA-box binding protein (TBP) (component of TFIID and TFIIIB)
MTKSPHFDGWLEYVKYVSKIPVNLHKFDFEILEIMATESKNMKTTFVSSETLETLIINLIPINIYKTVAKVAAKFWECAGYYIGDEICELMVGNILRTNLEKLHEKLNTSKENQISGFVYDPERFTAFLMKINSPAHKDFNNTSAKQAKKDREKQTTIKLYSKGKINIDGANNSEEANYLYYWLNSFLRDTPGILYDPEVEMDDLDASNEWSYCSSDMTSDE